MSGGGALAVDGDHDVYVEEGSQVVELNSSGAEVGIPIGSGLLSNSSSVAVNAAGDLLVGNPKRSNVQVFGPSELDPTPQVDSPVVIDAVDSSETRKTSDFQTTSTGEFAVFPSTLPLTGFQTGGHTEIYRYDRGANSITCVSCDSTGVLPTGDSSLASRGLSLTEAGQVFFTSAEPLVEADGDQRRDVYEWEAKGLGNCQTATGCVGLISSGTSAFDSELLGVSANGADAYFLTRDSLAPQDENGHLVKIYDAREGGGIPYTPPTVPCKASDECHGPGTPTPIPPALDSGGGHGGNGLLEAPKKCTSRHPRHRGKCISRHRHRKHQGKKGNRHG